MQEITFCPICDHNDFSEFLICTDHLVTKERFTIVTCNNCKFRFTNPRPSLNQLDKSYQSADYISHTKGWQSLTQLGYLAARYFSTRNKLRWIRKVKPVGNSLLDYGCGVGYFLKTAQNYGWSAMGIEPSAKAREIAGTGGKVILTQLADLDPSNKFDIITLWHVLEHIPDLNGIFAHLKSLLNPKGCMIIAVPNCNSHDAERYQEFWAAYDVPRHLYHFSPQTMQQLLNRHQLKLKLTKSLKLDAYYISLLSEKYMGKPNAFVTAFRQGQLSNRWAKKNSLNYSSLIYVAQQ